MLHEKIDNHQHLTQQHEALYLNIFGIKKYAGYELSLCEKVLYSVLKSADKRPVRVVTRALYAITGNQFGGAELRAAINTLVNLNLAYPLVILEGNDEVRYAAAGNILPQLVETYLGKGVYLLRHEAVKNFEKLNAGKPTRFLDFDRDVNRVSLKAFTRNTASRLGIEKPKDIENHLQYSESDFRYTLEARFTEGMSWENYGTSGWHIDHTISIAQFKSVGLDDLRIINHLNNLKPMWANENIVKKDSRVPNRVFKEYVYATYDDIGINIPERVKLLLEYWDTH